MGSHASRVGLGSLGLERDSSAAYPREDIPCDGVDGVGEAGAVGEAGEVRMNLWDDEGRSRVDSVVFRFLLGEASGSAHFGLGGELVGDQSDVAGPSNVV